MKLVKWFDENFEEITMMLFCAVMATIMIIQVAARYLFKASLSWSEELTRFIFIWSAFLSISYCIRKRLSIQITLLIEAFPFKVRYAFIMMVDLICLCLYGYLTPKAISYLGQTIANGQLSTALRVPMWVIYLAPCVGFFLSTIRSFQMLVLDYRIFHKGEGEEEAKASDAE